MSAFDPFVKRFSYRCNGCGERITLFCLNGAIAPDPRRFRCADYCRKYHPAGEQELEEIVDAERQLRLVPDNERAVRRGLETDRNSRPVKTAPKPVGERFGEPIEAGGRPQRGGGR